MKRNLIPHSASDRIAVAAIPFLAYVTFVSYQRGDYWGAAFSIVAVVMVVIGAYVLQDPPASVVETSRYSEVIANIASISRQLSELSKFLEGERARVAETEATVSKG